ncbi:MAG: methyltransferase domain-containing protein [Acidobacteria bacterium]|nr:methyltransferase domain-containing protein [Acidobacteriota bacterium]
MRKQLALAIALAAPLSAQVADKANERYRTAEGRQGMLANLSAEDRAARLKGEVIVKELGIQPGSTVADLGTGGGAMLPLFSEAVGAQGKVIAEDIFQDFLAPTKTKYAALKNVSYVLGTEKDVKLAAATVDLAVTIDAYHHWDYPAEVLASVKKALRPGGRFVIVDYFKRAGAMDAPGVALQHIRLDRDDVIKEVSAHGFALERTVEHVPGKQYLAIFTPVR